MTRRRGHERVLETLDLALSLGFDPVKVARSVSDPPGCCICPKGWGFCLLSWYQKGFLQKNMSFGSPASPATTLHKHYH